MLAVVQTCLIAGGVGSTIVSRVVPLFKTPCPVTDFCPPSGSPCLHSCREAQRPSACGAGGPRRRPTAARRRRFGERGRRRSRPPLLPVGGGAHLRRGAAAEPRHIHSSIFSIWGHVDACPSLPAAARRRCRRGAPPRARRCAPRAARPPWPPPASTAPVTAAVASPCAGGGVRWRPAGGSAPCAGACVRWPEGATAFRSTAFRAPAPPPAPGAPAAADHPPHLCCRW